MAHRGIGLYPVLSNMQKGLTLQMGWHEQENLPAYELEELR